MKWSIEELTSIRVLVGRLLDEIGLRSYVFNVEQDETNWIILVDFPHHDDWQALDLRVDKDLLRDCLEHPETCQGVSSAWKDKLARLS